MVDGIVAPFACRDHRAVDFQDLIEFPAVKGYRKLIPLTPPFVERDQYSGIVLTLRSGAVIGHAVAFRDSSTTIRGSRFETGHASPRAEPGSRGAFRVPSKKVPYIASQSATICRHW